MSRSAPPNHDQRAPTPVDAVWVVDCEGDDTFLFASITNLAAMGVFVKTNEPLEVGTAMQLCFTPRDGSGSFVMLGEVQWINRLRTFGENPNPGMGILFIDLTPEERERVVAVIRTIIYLRGEPPMN